MKYIVDAQLPRKLVKWMNAEGYNAIHTLDLPDKNATSDSEIIRISSLDNMSVIVSKDKDFPEQRIIRGKPERLLWITTGNIRNEILLGLFSREFKNIHDLFVKGSLFVELSNDSITIHE